MQNLKKVILFALPTNFAQGFCIVMAIIIGMPSPLTAMQVLTVNMVSSVTLGIVIALGMCGGTRRRLRIYHVRMCALSLQPSTALPRVCPVQRSRRVTS